MPNWKDGLVAVLVSDALKGMGHVGGLGFLSRAGQGEYNLGLEHEDKGRRRAAPNFNRYNSEKAVKIWN